MGFLSKLKNNLTGGGVKVTLVAPGSINLDDGVVPVTVSVSAGESAQLIKAVRLELMEVSEETSLGYSDDDRTERTENTIASIANEQPFNINSHETKIIELGLVLPGKTSVPTESSILGKAQTAFSKISNVLDTSEKSYYFKAKADVDGVALDPNCKQDVVIK